MKRRKNPHAVALGRRGGRKGGLARVPKGTALWTPEQWAAWREKRAGGEWCPCGCGRALSDGMRRHPRRIRMLSQ